LCKGTCSSTCKGVCRTGCKGNSFNMPSYGN
jgi:hypothetical protein